jgi:NADH-quinone oxidoreductase subunit C
MCIERGEVLVSVESRSLVPFLARCKSDPALRFGMLLDVTAVDWMDERPERFELVYQLLSIPFQNRLHVRVRVAEGAPEVDSVVPLWSSANFLEREVWDMFGIRFRGHPDLRRILMYEEFVGHPLRKDYPVQGKQPRIALRAPEVENTARRMDRPDLVTIRRRSDGTGRTQGLSGQQPGMTGQK